VFKRKTNNQLKINFMQKKISWRLSALVLSFIFPITINVHAQQKNSKPSSTSAALPLDPAVRTGKLSNGFTYYIRHNEEPQKRVTLYLVNKVGSILEDEDQRGLAHFMEHMSFNGTTHYPKNELINYLQKSGVRFGADINASTNYDQTVYQLPLPADNPELLKNGIQILRDWAQNATLDPVEIDKERGVVLEEKRLGKGASERMQQQYMPVILDNSRYASRSPIGTDKVLNNFKPATIRRFYHDWYRPDLQAIIVVGDINVNQIEKQIRLKFADLKNPANERPRPSYHVALTGKNHFVAVTDKEMTATVAEVIIKHAQLPLRSAEDYRKMIIRGLFNTMLGERYAELSRKPNLPFIQAAAGINGFIGALDSYDATVVAKPGELEHSFKALWLETERVKRFGFTIAELERAKKVSFNQIEATYEERDKAPSESYVEEYMALFLKHTPSPGIAREFQLVKQYLPGISLPEVNQIAADYVTSANRDILILAPDKYKGQLPAESLVLRWMDEVSREQLKPIEHKQSAATVLITPPAPGKIISEQQDKESGITTLVLSNGIKVLLKPTTYKNNEILFTAFSPGGTSVYSDGDFQSASFANVVPSFGAGHLDNDELNKYLSGKQINIRPFISERIQGVNGAAANKDMESAMELMYAYFTEPRKDPVLSDNMLSRSKAELANRSDSPGSVYQDTVSAVLGNYNIRRTGPSMEKLNRINPDRAFEIYKERFANAAGLTFLFVGSTDSVSMKPLIEKYIASLPVTGSPDEAKDLHIHIPEGVIERRVYKGNEPKATVTLVYSGPFDYSPENELKMEAVKEVIQIRLIERLREEESGVYSPYARVAVTKLPEGRFNLFISFGCGPQNADKLIASAQDEITKLRTDGPRQVNVDKFKAESLRTMETKIQSNDFWLGYLNGQLQNAESINQINGYSAMINKITAADIKEFANTYLSGKNFIKLILLPGK